MIKEAVMIILSIIFFIVLIAVLRKVIKHIKVRRSKTVFEEVTPPENVVNIGDFVNKQLNFNNEILDKLKFYLKPEFRDKTLEREKIASIEEELKKYNQEVLNLCKEFNTTIEELNTKLDRYFDKMLLLIRPAIEKNTEKTKEIIEVKKDVDFLKKELARRGRKP